ncbi:MAG TPA: 30S ribosomal protein S20 [Candidatus Saccharimonadales bacterium]|nr:30S ribosomal protein S20 [Candidatus Saccharimonadales bacterium]
MPIIKSAKKRVKTATKANVRNTRTRKDMREAVKAFNKALESGKTAEISKFQKAAISSIDIAAKKNVIHKNKASRKKAQLSAQAKAAGVKPAKAAAKKAAAKPVARKVSAKKPAAKAKKKSS